MLRVVLMPEQEARLIAYCKEGAKEVSILEEM